MDELDELLPRKGLDYQRLIIRALSLLSIIVFLFSLAMEGNLEKVVWIGVAAIIAWTAFALAVRYRKKAKNPVAALISLIVSLIVGVILTIIFFYQYIAFGGISGLI